MSSDTSYLSLVRITEMLLKGLTMLSSLRPAKMEQLVDIRIIAKEREAIITNSPYHRTMSRRNPNRAARLSRLTVPDDHSSSSDDEPIIIDELWVITEISRMRVEYNLDRPTKVTLLVKWEWTGQPRGSSWEPIQLIDETAREAIIHFMEEHTRRRQARL